LFDQLKNISGMAGLLKNANQLQEQFRKLQEELATHRIEAETGGGAVRVVVNGAMQVISIETDPAMLVTLVDVENEEDRRLAQELIAGAVNAAFAKAKQHVSEEISTKAQEMGLPIPPGTDLTKLLGGA